MYPPFFLFFELQLSLLYSRIVSVLWVFTSFAKTLLVGLPEVTLVMTKKEEQPEIKVKPIIIVQNVAGR